MTRQIHVGISRCLLGQKVRFDGSHKKDAYVMNLLSDYFSLEGVCPEVESGLPIPRPTIRLTGDPNAPKLVEVLKPDVEHTDRLVSFSEEKVKEYQHLSGFILKSKSPSCGMERVKVYQPQPQQPKMGRGIFADRLLKQYPLLPVEEEGRLNDFRLRENFIERVFTYYRWQQLNESPITAKGLLAFHSQHKLTLLAHNQAAYRRLGKYLTDLKSVNLTELSEKYIADFMLAMKKPATRKNHTNVLMHIQGYFKEQLDTDDKAELTQSIDHYRQGLLPLIVPVTLLKHYLRKYPDPYLEMQAYLFPYPEELMLRNHI